MITTPYAATEWSLHLDCQSAQHVYDFVRCNQRFAILTAGHRGYEAQPNFPVLPDLIVNPNHIVNTGSQQVTLSFKAYLCIKMLTIS